MRRDRVLFLDFDGVLGDCAQELRAATKGPPT